LTDTVLFDRDGTLVQDVPYNGDPDAVVAMPGAREALDRLRAHGLRVGVVTNQSAALTLPPPVNRPGGSRVVSSWRPG